MRLVILAAATALLAAPMPLAAAPSPEFSWGKAGITIEQYRLDAVQCGRKGYYRDVSNTEAAHVFRKASQQYDTITDSGAPAVNKWEAGSLDANYGAASISRIEEAPVHFVELGQRVGQLVASTQPEKRMAEVRVYLEEAVTSCLTERGYTRFRLTRDQRARLSRLHLGSPERHAFMFSLASDPRVLATQAIA
jgi:hypothetical protein